jgi:hypothetical protein
VLDNFQISAIHLLLILGDQAIHRPNDFVTQRALQKHYDLLQELFCAPSRIVFPASLKDCTLEIKEFFGERCRVTSSKTSIHQTHSELVVRDVSVQYGP